MKALKHRQRGIVAVLVAVGLVGLLAMVGLAIESSHLELNKSRLQNTVDAAALAAAKVLDQTGSEASATTAARSVFDLNAANHPELKSVLSGADITVEYSTTLNPFAPGTIPANYVRVRADDFTMWSSFSMVVGIDELSTAASAVAGPSAPITKPCKIVPMTVCGEESKKDWGFSRDKVTILKVAPPSGQGSTIGPGNFQLIRLGGPGDKIVRESLAGGYEGCVVGDTVETQPGTGTGPVRDGLNTRFDQYRGGMKKADYPPDMIARRPDPFELDSPDMGTTVVLRSSGEVVEDVSRIYSHSDYDYDYQQKAWTNPEGQERRREIAVPIVNCPAGGSGVENLEVIGSACFFLLQPLGQGALEGLVFAQLIRKCSAAGAAGPVGGEGLYKIVLHNDPSSPDS